MSIAGHVSRAMLSRYSHVRMEAKRRALDEIATRQCAADEKRKAEANRQQEVRSLNCQWFSNRRLDGRFAVQAPLPHDGRIGECHRLPSIDPWRLTRAGGTSFGTTARGSSFCG
jgi:hypothetical protein